jgi:hypothetical protein
MENIEHGVEAMGGSKLLVVSSDAELAVGVDVHIRDVDTGLMPVDVIDLLLVEYHLPLVDVDERLLLRGSESSKLVLTLALLAEYR